MANKLSWVLEMVDKVSGPTKTAKGSLGDFIQTTHSALAAVQLIGQAAVGAGRLIASGLQPAISREKSLGAFETLLGTAEKARNMYGQAVKFAADTPFETSQVVDAFQRLLTAKFSEEEVPIALQIIGDAASMQEDSQAAVSSVTRALSQIRSKGRLQGEELMQLQEAVPINTASLYEKLGKIYGTNAQQARKMVEAGQVDSQAASFAILEQLSEQFGGNMARASKQIGGLVSTLQGRPAEFLAKLQDTQGYDSLRDVLGRMAGAFDPETSGLTPFITQLGSGVLERASVSIEYLSSGAVAFAEGLRSGLGPIGETFGPANQTNLEKFRTTMEGFGEGAGQLAGAINTLISPIKAFFGLFYDFGEWQASSYGELVMKPLEWLMSSKNAGGTLSGTTQQRLVAQRNQDKYGVPVGHSLTDVERSSYSSLAGMGRRAGAESYLRGLGTVNPLNTNTDNAMMDAMLAASGYGMDPEDMADAYGLPRYAAGGIVRRPTVALIGESGPEAVVPLRGGSGRRMGGGGIPTINASFVFNGVAGTQEAAQDIRREVEAGMLATYEKWALQSGRYAP